MAVTDIGAEIRHLFEDSLDRHLMGDDVRYAMSLLPGQDGSAFYFALWMPSGILGAEINFGAFMPNPPAFLTEEAMDGFVNECMEAMRNMRSQVLAQGLEAAIDPQQVHLPSVDGNGQG